MTRSKSKTKFRSIIRWITWALLLQFVLINISAALYAYKFTHFYSAAQRVIDTGKPVSQNFFAKTWRLFKGPRFYKRDGVDLPVFPFETVVLKTRNNKKIEAWYSKADSFSKGTVILFHGLSANKGTVIEEAGEFRHWHYNVLLVDVRAHGNSEGSTTTIGFYESEEVKLSYDYVSQLGEKNIYLWGASMGGSVIIKAVAEYDLKVRGIITEMPFRSLQSHIEGRIRLVGFPEQPFAFLVTFWIGAEHGFNGYRFNSTRYAKKVICPVLLQYAGNDGLVKQEEIKDIFGALASKNKKLVLYKNAIHGLLLEQDTPLWRKEVEEFLRRSE